MKVKIQGDESEDGRKEMKVNMDEEKMEKRR